MRTPCFRIATLASGSSGNSIYAESPDGALVIDAGISGRGIADGIDAVGGNIDAVEAVIITHDHTDHSKNAGVLARRHGMDVLMSEGTRDGCGDRLGEIDHLKLFCPGEIISAGGFHVHTIVTPHDGEEPAVVILERNGVLCGIFTDLGHVTSDIRERIEELDGVFLESNYDPQMLEEGFYPESVKARIRSDHGHISNIEAGELVRDHAGPGMQFVILAHLSEENNTPDTAEECMLEIAGERLEEYGIDVSVAPRHTPGAFVEMRLRG